VSKIRNHNTAPGHLLTELRIMRTDALSGIRTGEFGKLMEDSYRAAIDESGVYCQPNSWFSQLSLTIDLRLGKGSHARRKAIINGRVGDGRLFRDLSIKVKETFDGSAETLEATLQDVVDGQLKAIMNTVNILRHENAALEGETDPEFRRRVGRGVADAKEGLQRIQTLVGI
jgi:hypothetical protein